MCVVIFQTTCKMETLQVKDKCEVHLVPLLCLCAWVHCLVQCQLASRNNFLLERISIYPSNQQINSHASYAYHLEYQRSVFGCLPSVGQPSSESWLACLLGTSEWHHPLPRLVAHCRQPQSWSFAVGWLGSYYQSALDRSAPVRDPLYQGTRQVLP